VNLSALTGQEDVHSNKRKSARVDISVRAAEYAPHEPHVRIDEGQTHDFAGFMIGLRDHPADVRQPDRGVEICDRHRFCIDGIERCGAEHVESSAEERRAARDWNGSK